MRRRPWSCSAASRQGQGPAQRLAGRHLPPGTPPAGRTRPSAALRRWHCLHTPAMLPAPRSHRCRWAAWRSCASCRRNARSTSWAWTGRGRTGATRRATRESGARVAMPAAAARLAAAAAPSPGLGRKAAAAVAAAAVARAAGALRSARAGGAAASASAAARAPPSAAASGGARRSAVASDARRRSARTR